MSMGPLDAPTFAGVAAVKQHFPAAGTLLSRVIAAVSATYNSGTPGVNAQANGSGIHALILTPITYPVLVTFDASSNVDAKNKLDDATTDSDTLQVRYIPVGNMLPITFSSAVTRWDLKAVGGATDVYQVQVL